MLCSLVFRREHNPSLLNEVSAAWAQSGQEHKLAASPLTAVVNPIMDLPFSPRAAFIWDQSRQAVTWMNAAARTKFALGPDDLSSAIPASLARKFGQYPGKAAVAANRGARVKVKVAGEPALACCIEILELAGGRPGLIVAEIEAAGDGAAAPRSRFAKNGPPCTAAKRPDTKSSTKTPAKTRTPPKARRALPQLTPEELRSFKAIGRIVRKLCEKKQREALGLPQQLVLASSSKAPSPPAQQKAAPVILFLAFDLVLLLDEHLSIVGSEGRPQQIGWRKSLLLGRPAVQLLPASEQPAFYRMVRKLSPDKVQLCRETVTVSDGTPAGLPCRAVLGRWDNGGADYFLALMSLKLPQRLKSLHGRPVRNTNVTWLAA